MDPKLLLAFWGMALLLILVPGPDWAFVLASGIRRRTIAPAVGGLMIGYLVLTGIVAAGVGAVLVAQPSTLTALTLVGAGYLGYLGVRTLRSSAAPQQDSPAVVSAGTRRRVLLNGMAVSALNPKGLLLFLAMLPQFARGASWPEQLQLTVLGLVFVGTCGLFYTVLGTGAGAVLLRRPALGRALTMVSGVAMVVIGVLLVVERLILRG